MMIIIYFHLILQFLRNCFYDNRQKNDEFYRVPAVAYFCILTFAFFLLVSHKDCSWILHEIVAFTSDTFWYS